MHKSFTALSAWSRKALRSIKAFEDALDYRYEDYAQDRFAKLEKRVDLLEKQAVPTALKAH